MRIEWKTPPNATPLYALLAYGDGLRPVDPQQAALVQNAVNVVEGIDRPKLVALASAVATGEAVSVGEDVLAFFDAWPDADLAYRVRPLREQWEARGPGLLRQLEQLTEPLGVDAATVALVSPVVGGHGLALPSHAAVLFEGLLANLHPQLPEVVRLAWLLAQLAEDAHPLALAPAVLAAAEEVELASADESTLALALTAWRITSDANHATELASRLWRWWCDWQAATPWRIAMTSVPTLGQ